MMEFTYAVVGGGIAGVSCVEQILEYEPEARILLISSSSVVKEATNVTRLTKTLQDFVLIEKSLKSFKDVHQTVHVLHDNVSSLDSKAHVLKTNSGQEFEYKKICICTGGRPNVVFPESDYVVGIRDTESVQKLATRITNCKRLLLIGNGGIATEFVHEVEGVEVIWAIKDKSISAHYVDPGAAEFFIQSKLKDENEVAEEGSHSIPKKYKTDKEIPPIVTKRKQYKLSFPELDSKKLEGASQPGSALGPDWHRNVNLHGLEAKKNVTILYETEVSKVTSLVDVGKTAEDTEKWPIYAEFNNGKIIGADLMISATGVKPNCEWAKDCNQDAEKGIFVDTAMRSSAPDVFAAGDVCFPNWKWAKHWFQMKLWTQARQMGLYAGKSMYLSHIKDLKEKYYSPEDEIELDFCFEIFSHVTKFFSYKVVLLGLFNGQGLDPSKLELLIRCTKGLEYIKVVLEEGRMQGALLIGDTGLEETFENLILNQVDLTPYGEDLLNPNIDIEDYFD